MVSNKAEKLLQKKKTQKNCHLDRVTACGLGNIFYQLYSQYRANIQNNIKNLKRYLQNK